MTDWRDRAACRDQWPDLFFPFDRDEAAIAEAKAVCARCDVRQECGDWADDHDMRYGVWGGGLRNEHGHNSGGDSVDTAAVDRLVNGSSPAGAQPVDYIEAVRRLTDRGYSSSTIAAQLGVSIRTVIRHRKAVVA